MCVQIYTERSITNYPVTRRHTYPVMILNAVDHIQDGTGCHETLMTQKALLQKVLMEYLSRNMSMLDDNIKIDIKGIIFIFRLFSSLHQGQIWIFGKK